MFNQEFPVEIVDGPAATRPQPSEAKKTSKGLLVVIPVMFSLLGLVIGAAIGAVSYSITGPTYESQCRIWLEDAGNSFPHKEVIASNSIFEPCLTDYHLQDLRSLRDLSHPERLAYLKQHLTVESASDDENILELRFVSTDPRDAQTFLATVVTVYERHLARLGELDSEDEIAMKMLDAPMTMLDAPLRGESRSLDPIRLIGFSALMGLVIGFLVGAVFSLILK